MIDRYNRVLDEYRLKLKRKHSLINNMRSDVIDMNSLIQEELLVIQHIGKLILNLENEINRAESGNDCEPDLPDDM